MSGHTFALFFFPSVCSYFSQAASAAILPSALLVSDFRSVLGGCSRFSRCCYLIIVLSSHRFGEGRSKKTKYLKPKPRTDQAKFADICDQAIDDYKTFTRGSVGIEGRVAVFKKWWPGRTAKSITRPEIKKQLLANLASRGLAWSECAFNE
jgi:hypothetical protein